MDSAQPEPKVTVTYKIKGGTKVQIETDAETAQQIGQYRDIYNKFKAFSLISREYIPHSPNGFHFDQDVITVSSRNLIVCCTKIYMPDTTIKYKCKIANSKSPAESVNDIVAQLYFDLFDGCQQR